MDDLRAFAGATVISFPSGSDARESAAEHRRSPATLAERLACWVKRRAFRRELTRLLEASPHLIRDIGLDEAAVRRETQLPFWRPGPLAPGGLPHDG
ncbi:DUF1127 domain-containing protein [Pelagibius sp.]|uniref:DUF1127 domain-containing protein n=1 Tax=Pelagibius sp. TaxID=1931238 RepID=UPI003B514FCE